MITKSKVDSHKGIIPDHQASAVGADKPHFGLRDPSPSYPLSLVMRIVTGQHTSGRDWDRRKIPQKQRREAGMSNPSR